MERVLRFLSIVDRFGDLSITNLAVIALITRFMLVPEWTTAAALACALLGYGYKRSLVAGALKHETEVTEVRLLTARVQELANLQETVAKQAAATQKQHEETQRLLSANAMASSFKAPVRRAQAQTHVAG